MTITADEYIDRVLNWMPRATPQREQIALELRGHIEERLAQGGSLDRVLEQLGDPAKLADSYLAAVPLVPAPFFHRVAARIVDTAVVITVMLPLSAIGAHWGLEVFLAVLFVTLFAAGFLLPLYMVVGESRYSQTLGKKLLGLRVVRESGARISAGQAIVRQLPAFLQVFVLDALFALFTEKHQRAFEMLSHTRVVRVEGEESGRSGAGPRGSAT